jgi:anti-sigma-K factor RskA
VNIKEYISSGIVEGYVLGLASGQERTEFEQLCAQYSELVEARTNFELLLEKRAMENAEKPPVYSKEKIWSVIEQTPASKTSKIITMEPVSTRRNSGIRWVAAASVILLIGSAYLAYDFYNQNKELKTTTKDLQSKLDAADSILQEQKIINDPHVTVVSMVGMTPQAPAANIYWDTTSANVYLVVKNMPKLASDKQYQLWSLIDSNGLKPTSLGLFDGGKEKVILKMNNAQKADAFAITIEQKGNTGGPDLKQLQNMGKTKL